MACWGTAVYGPDRHGSFELGGSGSDVKSAGMRRKYNLVVELLIFNMILYRCHAFRVQPRMLAAA